MNGLVASLFVLVCVAQATLGLDFNCSTDAGQLAFLQNGATTYPNCYTPVVNLIVLKTLPTAAQIQVICQEDCAGEMLEFLGKCSDNQLANDNAYFVREELCAYKGDKPESSCILEDYSQIQVTLTSCFGWFYGTDAGKSCPPLLAGVPAGTPMCADALKAATGNYSCCFQNLFGGDEYIREVTEASEANLPAGTVPDDFEVDITDPDLFAVCGVELPKMCVSQVASAPGLLATPLVALLFAILTKLIV